MPAGRQLFLDVRGGPLGVGQRGRHRRQCRLEKEVQGPIAEKGIQLGIEFDPHEIKFPPELI